MARRVAVYAGGREGLQIRGFAMRLFHLGRSVSVVGDMTTPAIGAGDLFLVACGPGEIFTAVALVGVAKAVGARILVVTAQPEGWVPRMADDVLVLPARTMADDRGPSPRRPDPAVRQSWRVAQEQPFRSLHGTRPAPLVRALRGRLLSKERRPMN